MGRVRFSPAHPAGHAAPASAGHVFFHPTRLPLGYHLLVFGSESGRALTSSWQG